MSFSFPSSGGWDPASQRTVGWRGSSTRRAGPVGEAVPAEKWARLRAAAATPVPTLAAVPGASSTPRPSLDTEESALLATQQFAQGEREGKLRAALDRLTSTTRATRSAVDATASAVRAQSAAAERRARGLADEIGKVRRAVHAADARRDVAKTAETTLGAVRETLKSFAVAQEKTIAKAAGRGVEERVARAEAALSDVAEWQRAQGERLGRMEDALQELLRQARCGGKGEEERTQQKQTREGAGSKTRQRSRAHKESASVDGSVSVDGEESILAKRSARDRKRKKGEVGNGRNVRQKRVTQTMDSSFESSMDSHLGSGAVPRVGTKSVRNAGNEEEEQSRGGPSDEDDSVFADSNVDRESVPPVPAAPGSSPGLAPWMLESGVNEQNMTEEYLSIPCVIRRKKPASVSTRRTMKRNRAR